MTARPAAAAESGTRSATPTAVPTWAAELSTPGSHAAIGRVCGIGSGLGRGDRCGTQAGADQRERGQQLDHRQTSGRQDQQDSDAHPVAGEPAGIAKTPKVRARRATYQRHPLAGSSRAAKLVAGLGVGGGSPFIVDLRRSPRPD
jgi:hypothetical protein